MREKRGAPDRKKDEEHHAQVTHKKVCVHSIVLSDVLVVGFVDG
jgi:hypothetical protein